VRLGDLLALLCHLLIDGPTIEEVAKEREEVAKAHRPLDPHDGSSSPDGVEV